MYRYGEEYEAMMKERTDLNTLKTVINKANKDIGVDSLSLSLSLCLSLSLSLLSTLSVLSLL
jgi:hypothetical protein